MRNGQRRRQSCRTGLRCRKHTRMSEFHRRPQEGPRRLAVAARSREYRSSRRGSTDCWRNSIRRRAQKRQRRDKSPKQWRTGSQRGLPAERDDEVAGGVAPIAVFLEAAHVARFREERMAQSHRNARASVGAYYEAVGHHVPDA